jgi:hypothetical protein
MEDDQEQIDEVMRKAGELTKVMSHIEEIISGMSYGDRISLISTLMMKNVVQEHKTSMEVVADMGTIFATMITSFRVMNAIEEEDDDDLEEENVKQ